MREGRIVAFPGYGRLVEGTTTQIDEDGLFDALPIEQRRLITRTVLDRAALERAIADGKINPTVVLHHTTDVPRAAYLRTDV